MRSQRPGGRHAEVVVKAGFTVYVINDYIPLQAQQ